jgi:hypothetical protein
LGPLRIGFFYGSIAVVVALAADLRFLFLDPQTVPDWILAAIEEFRTQLVLTTILFLGILAAIRTRPTRMEPGVPYRSVLLRDCVLAATAVAVMAGFALCVATALSATVFADEIRAYASDATPSIVSYNEKVAGRLDEPPPLPPAAEIEDDLQPPVLRDLGRSMANLVLRALIVGTAGAVVGLIRGRSGASSEPKPRTE